MTSATQEKLTEFYGVYNGTIKLLIAEIEAKTQKFPIELFNEIRSYNDHIARCYIPGSTQAIHDTELRKAESHIIRITLDCYKFLNVMLHKKVIRRFDRRTKGVNLSAISNGDFFTAYSKAKQFIEEFDGFSIGSNDMTQMVLATDRDNARLSHIYDEEDPAVVWAILVTIFAGQKYGKKVGFCGQGVSNRPSRSGFSPMAKRISRTAFSMRSVSMRLFSGCGMIFSKLVRVGKLYCEHGPCPCHVGSIGIKGSL